jgi:uncharacterized protein (TIGR03437 family)
MPTFPWLTNLRRALLCALLTLPAIAQTNTPFVFSVGNSANYNGTIAQGSLIVVFGASIGPAQLAQAGSVPLPLQVGGTAITVTSGSTMLSCPMVYASAGQAAAVLPSNVAPGKAMLNLSYNGQSNPFPTPVNVVPSAVGIYTLGSSGLGLGVITGMNGLVKTFAASAKSGETVTAWATGLGPVNGPANVVPSTFPNFPGVEVFVGTQVASVIYAGRSGCCVGLDQISFEVPAGVTGCYVPVAIRSGGTISNFVSIAVNSGGGACSDTAPTVPVSIMNRASTGQSVKVAGLAAGPVAVLRGLGFNERLYLADKLSNLLRVKVSQEDVAKLVLAEQTHNPRALIRAMTKYAALWKALDPASKAAVQAVLNPNQEGAVADFGLFTSPGTLASAIGGLFPSQGTCSTIPAEFVARTGNGLDAGSSLALSGPAGSWTLTPNSSGEYQVLFGSAPTGPNLPPGSYVLTGSGGHDLSSFSATLQVGGNVVWANKATVSTIDRSQPLTVTWSGGTNPGFVLIGGYVFSNIKGLAAFACTENISAGSFTIPSFILSVLPPAATGGVMFIGPHPLSQQVAIPGMDLAYFMDGSNDSKSVVYQ